MKYLTILLITLTLFSCSKDGLSDGPHYLTFESDGFVVLYSTPLSEVKFGSIELVVLDTSFYQLSPYYIEDVKIQVTKGDVIRKVCAFYKSGTTLMAYIDGELYDIQELNDSLPYDYMLEIN